MEWSITSEAEFAEKSGEGGLSRMRKAGGKAEKEKERWDSFSVPFPDTLNRSCPQERNFLKSIGQRGSSPKRLKEDWKSSFTLDCHLLNSACVCSSPNAMRSSLEEGLQGITSYSCCSTFHFHGFMRPALKFLHRSNMEHETLKKHPSESCSHSPLPPDAEPSTRRMDLTHSSISDWEVAMSTQVSCPARFRSPEIPAKSIYRQYIVRIGQKKDNLVFSLLNVSSFQFPQ